MKKKLYDDKTREEIIKILVEEDCAMWTDDFKGAIEYIEGILLGDTTVRPYSEFSDEELIVEYKEYTETEEEA